MAGSGKEIPGGHGRDIPEVDGSGGGEALGQLLRVADGQRDVLGGKGIGDLYGLIQISDMSEHGIFDRLGEVLRACRECHLAIDFLLYRDEEFLRIAQQDCDAGGAVLRLGQQIGGDPNGIGLGIGDHEHLAGPGEKVDADAPEDLTLCLDDVGVARSEDFGDRTDRPRPVGKGRNGLRSADAVNFGDAAEIEGRNQGRSHSPVRSRRGDGDDFRHACRLGEATGHDGCGDERCGSPWNIDADTGKWIEALADKGAFTILHRPIFTQALLGKGGDVFERGGKGFPDSRGEGGARLPDLGLRDAKPCRSQLGTTKFRCISAEGRIPLGAYVRDDPGDSLPHLGGGFRLSVELCDLAVETAAFVGEKAHSRDTTRSGSPGQNHASPRRCIPGRPSDPEG